MSQSRAGSLAETLASTGIGFCVAFIATATIMPAFGYQVTAADNVAITAIFTAISIARGYLVRRLFNKINRGRK